MSIQPIQPKIAGTTKKTTIPPQGEAAKNCPTCCSKKVRGERACAKVANNAGTPVSTTGMASAATMHPTLLNRQNRKVKNNPKENSASMQKAVKTTASA